MTLDEILELGFDNSKTDDDDDINVSCSQCDALVINGVPCHEQGCPNAVSDEEDEEFDEYLRDIEEADLGYDEVDEIEHRRIMGQDDWDDEDPIDV